jgi:hypothetical protein
MLTRTGRAEIRQTARPSLPDPSAISGGRRASRLVDLEHRSPLLTLILAGKLDEVK